MRIARKLIFATLVIIGFVPFKGLAQYIATPDSISRVLAPVMGLSDSLAREKSDSLLDILPRINYEETPKAYVVGDVRIHGTVALDPQMVIDNFNIQAGDTIMIPGDAITIATRSMLDRRYFSNMKVGTSFQGDTVNLDLYIRERVQVREWVFNGIKKSEQRDLNEKLRLRRNHELSDYILKTNTDIIRKYYDEKAFRNAIINYRIVPDTLIESAVVVHFDIHRGERVKVGAIEFAGNEGLSQKRLRKAMKKTNKVSWKFWKPFKFKEKEFKEDLELVKSYARSNGYRDVVIVKDSTWAIPKKPKRLGVYIEIDEGNLYHYRNISWLGNTIYPTEVLEQELGLRAGDIYDSETMDERLQGGGFGEVSISSYYKNRGYLAFMAEPVETVVPGDSIDVEIRIIEGSQFRIKNVTFEGNTRTHDHVIRRELHTRPGDLYSQQTLMYTYQQLTQMGQFDATTLNPNINPNMQQELVDINYQLTEVPNDQLELSGGWGAGMFIASVGVNFTNVSMRNLFKKDAWKPYPAGDNQTIGLKVQTNGSYYRAFSVNFIEPWLGGRKPTSLSVTFFTSRETDQRYITDKATAHFGTIGGSIGIGKRLSWPDPYFTASFGVTIQSYNLWNWNYFILRNGRSNTLAFNFGLARNSVDDLYQYPTWGSNFSLNVAATPPWSAFDNKNYKDKALPDDQRYKWIEYHKWNLNAQWFFPLTFDKKLVLMTRAQYGYLGYYNSHKRSPFEGFQMGGDGLSGYSLYGVETIGLRGYENNALTPLADYGIYASIYSKYVAEVRYPIVRTGSTLVYALVFAEAGNAFNDLKEFKPFNLKRAAGVGFRVYLPYLGMLGIDWGYGFDKVAGSNGKAAGSKVSFSMGMQL